MTDIEGLLNPYGTTSLTGLDVFSIGEGLLNWVGTTVTLGHTRPNHTLDYAPWSGGQLHADVVRDFVAWSAGAYTKVPGCDVRLTSLMHDGGWLRYQVEQAAKTLGLEEAS